MYSVMWYRVVVVAFLQQSFIVGAMQWPRGEYALLKPKSGCPDNWKVKSWILQDTKSEWKNDRSRILHIDGYVAHYYVARSFCIRESNKNERVTDSSVWPRGQYCIYENNGLSTGSIQMTGEHSFNKDAVKYAGSFFRHDGTRRNIKFHFYCQTSGNKTTPISLPITKPFYLLPYGSRDCQQVQWMVATSEWIKFRTESIINGRVPYNLDNTHGIKMFYCYYQSCNHTLTDKGVFQSPGFPGKYPDGQLCSWRIMVPDNHTLHVRFTNFSLDKKDTLRYSKRINGSLNSRYTIPNCTKVPFELSSNSNTVFVFRSDESNNSTGFRAEYRVFMSDVKATPTTTLTESAATSSSATSSKPLTTPGSELNKETTKKASTTSKKEDTQTSTKTTNSMRSTTKSYIFTIQPKQTNTPRGPLTPTNCTTGDRAKKALTKSYKWNWKLVVIVIPLACLLLVIVLIFDIVYRCRSKRKNLRKSDRETRSVDRLPLVENPTYDRGAILLNQPNDPTIPTNLRRGNENDPRMNQPLTDKPPDYEDIENWKPSKTAPNMDHTIPQFNGRNACSDMTIDETSKIGDNPFYESAMTSPPFVEANQLYESVKMDQGHVTCQILHN